MINIKRNNHTQITNIKHNYRVFRHLKDRRGLTANNLKAMNKSLERHKNIKIEMEINCFRKSKLPYIY